MSGEQRKRKCPARRGQKYSNRDASTSTFEFPNRAPTESSATADNLSTDSDGDTSPSFFLNSSSIAALYNRMNSRPSPTVNPRPIPSENRRQASSESRQPIPSENRPPNTSENRRPAASENRRPTASENRRPIASENRRPTTSENRRPTASENRRQTTSENRRPTASENRPPAASENRRPLPLESRRPTAFDMGNLIPSDIRRQSLSENRRPNPSENRRPSRPTPADNQNIALDNARQPPAVQAPVPVRLPLQPRGQIPQAPRPPPAPTPATDYQALMNIFQGLSLLDRTVRKVRNNTGEFVSLLSSHVTVDAMGNFRRLEPAAIALYVVAVDETGKCCNCNREAATVCGKCRAACYCSSFCLQRDWGNHEVHCNLETLTFVQATAQQRLRI